MKPVYVLFKIKINNFFIFVVFSSSGVLSGVLSGVV